MLLGRTAMASSQVQTEESLVFKDEIEWKKKMESEFGMVTVDYRPNGVENQCIRV